MGGVRWSFSTHLLRCGRLVLRGGSESEGGEQAELHHGAVGGMITWKCVSFRRGKSVRRQIGPIKYFDPTYL